MRRTSSLLFLGLLWSGLGSVASADVVPDGVRGVRYTLTVENLADYPDHAFILYPTTNAGYGYVLEPNVGLRRVMMGERRFGPTRLHAMTRAELRRHDPSAPRHPHGDNGERVLVVDAPPGPPRSLEAAAAIHPPDLVPIDSTLDAVERVFRISRLDAQVFELTLVRETWIHRDGRREDRTSGAPPEATPEPTPTAEPAPAPAEPAPAPAARRTPPIAAPPAAAPESLSGCSVGTSRSRLPAFAIASVIALALLRRRR